MAEQPKRGRGRPPGSDADKLKPRMVRMTDEDWQFVKDMGGSEFIRSLVAMVKKGRKSEAETAPKAQDAPRRWVPAHLQQRWDRQKGDEAS